MSDAKVGAKKKSTYTAVLTALERVERENPATDEGYKQRRGRGVVRGTPELRLRLLLRSQSRLGMRETHQEVHASVTGEPEENSIAVDDAGVCGRSQHQGWE
jgi:hypothetical protein